MQGKNKTDAEIEPLWGGAKKAKGGERADRDRCAVLRQKARSLEKKRRREKIDAKIKRVICRKQVKLQ